MVSGEHYRCRPAGVPRRPTVCVDGVFANLAGKRLEALRWPPVPRRSATMSKPLLPGAPDVGT